MKFLYLIGSCSLVLFKRSLDVHVYSTYSVDCVYVHVWVSVYVYLATNFVFLNQACARLWLVHTWFLEIGKLVCVCAGP